MTIDREIAFAVAACLDKEESPFKQRRRSGKPYGRFTITQPVGHWADQFLGLEFLAEIYFKKNAEGKRKVITVIPVRFVGGFAVRGQPIPGEAVSMI